LTVQKRNTEGVVYLSEPSGSFENLYAKLRKAEKRDYTDDTVKTLPWIEKKHPHYNEWKIRDCSSGMLCGYIGKSKNAKKILELGCGNGWLTNRLSEIENSEVWGLDVNAAELKQAARVFGSKENILFACGDIFEIDPEKLKLKFDYIILPAVLAYFADPAKLIVKLTELLNSVGEIHIIDSPFYDDVHAAKERSMKYFESLGCGEMINYYHHHSLDVLSEFEYKIMYDPERILNKVKRFFSAASPFYWSKLS
jgi:SAM-dependent methyltransferase